jgi:hypothetical protein
MKTETVCKIELVRGDFGTYLITNSEDSRTVLVQTDWDFPATARTFGWDIQEVQAYAADEDGMTLETKMNCSHRGTDGTVTCPDCGVTATEFITAAGEWLDDNIGAEAEDPGYFDN